MNVKHRNKKPAKKLTAIKAYKGFDNSLQCRGYQFKVGETYEHTGPVKTCESGFHVCTDPFDVWSYYGPGDSRFCEVTASGQVEKHPEDSKIASARITIDAELTLPQFLTRAIRWAIDRAKGKLNDGGKMRNIGASGNYTRIGASGYGTRIGASGNYTHIGASGNHTHIGSSGDYTHIGSSGDYTHIGSSGYNTHIGASGNHTRIGSSGDNTRIGSSGDNTRIGASGNYTRIGASGYNTHIGASGDKSVIAASGLGNKFKLGPGGCAAIAYHDGVMVRFAVAYVGENILADVWYEVDSNGRFVEVGP